MMDRSNHKAGPVLVALICLALAPFQTQAADTSLRHVIGFSGDGKHFAFEEFGVSDGAW